MRRRVLPQRSAARGRRLTSLAHSCTRGHHAHLAARSMLTFPPAFLFFLSPLPAFLFLPPPRNSIEFFSFANGRRVGRLSSADIDAGAGAVHFLFAVAPTGEELAMPLTNRPEPCPRPHPTLIVVGVGSTVSLLAIELPSEAALSNENLRMLPAPIAQHRFTSDILSASIVAIGSTASCVFCSALRTVCLRRAHR